MANLRVLMNVTIQQRQQQPTTIQLFDKILRMGKKIDKYLKPQCSYQANYF